MNTIFRFCIILIFILIPHVTEAQDSLNIDSSNFSPKNQYEYVVLIPKTPSITFKKIRFFNLSNRIKIRTQKGNTYKKGISILNEKQLRVKKLYADGYDTISMDSIVFISRAPVGKTVVAVFLGISGSLMTVHGASLMNEGGFFTYFTGLVEATAGSSLIAGGIILSYNKRFKSNRYNYIFFKTDKKINSEKKMLEVMKSRGYQIPS